MRIAIVTTWYERGAAYVSRAYMNALKNDHEVLIYARGGHAYPIADPQWDLPCVTWSPRSNGFFRSSSSKMSMWHFSKWLYDNKIQVVLFNEQHNIEIVEETKKLGYRVGGYVDYYTDKTVPEFEIYDFLLCNTKRHYSVFQKHPKCLFVPWGTDIDLFRPTEKPSPASEVLRFFHSAGHGGVNLRKGTDLLIRAFRAVKGNAKLIIHSQAPLEKYGNIIEDIERDARIVFIHKTVPAPGLYHMGDIYVYPTKLEGIGLSVPEAMACGLAVITTDNPPMNEFVEDGYNGLLVHVASQKKRDDDYYWPEAYVDIDDLANKMQYYLDNRGIVENHCRNARKSVEDKFDWKKNSCHLEKWISHLEIPSSTRQPSWAKTLLWCGQDVFRFTQTTIWNLSRIIPSSFRGKIRRSTNRMLRRNT